MSIITIIIFLCYNNKKIETYIYNKKEEKNQNNQDINKIIIKTEIKKADAQSNEGSNKGKKVKSYKRRLISSPISNLNFHNNKINKTKKKKKRKRKNKKKVIFKSNLPSSQRQLPEVNLKENEIEEKIYNDYEMNSFSFSDAIKNDQRTYCQYYLSLLRTKHILIFTFYQNNDYNSQIIKIYLFFLTYYINYVISVMFYSDNTMHKIYIDKGAFDFTYQLPQMIYSLLISSILNTILKIFGLYEENIFEIKKYNKEIYVKEKIKTVIKKKVIIFFVITYIFLFLSWIYLGCFCAVYRNTKIHLLLDVTSSFGLSFITPFFISLLPGIFRITALKNKRPYMFKFSKLLQLL